MDSPIVRKIDKMKNSISKRMARERTFSNERNSANERTVVNLKIFKYIEIFLSVSLTFITLTMKKFLPLLEIHSTPLLSLCSQIKKNSRDLKK